MGPWEDGFGNLSARSNKGICGIGNASIVKTRER